MPRHVVAPVWKGCWELPGTGAWRDLRLLLCCMRPWMLGRDPGSGFALSHSLSF